MREHGTNGWRAAVGLTTATALLLSALLAVGAHEHLGPLQPEVECTVDHAESPASLPTTGLHAAVRAHRHHCAACQLVGSRHAQRLAAVAGVERPRAVGRVSVSPAALERVPLDAFASPRGPPAA